MSWSIEPSIKTISAKKLVGMKRSMTFGANNTGELWRSFMPRRHEIPKPVSSDLISMQIFPRGFDFAPQTEFVKWAAVEVAQIVELPLAMEACTIPEGLYAVFHYKGSSADPAVFRYIFGEWLPRSGFDLDDRPHFEILGEKYKNADPSSEEDIYIAIRNK